MKIGFALCGSFCTFEKAFAAMQSLAKEHSIIPIFSQSACTIDTRFGTAEAHLQRAAQIGMIPPLCSIVQTEPIGPQGLTDVLVVAPCTGNTLAKLAHGITDGPVTMAVKSHLRNEKPVVIAISTNDALSGSAQNIGILLNRKHFYFVPFRQDDPVKKPNSIVADFSRIPQTVAAAAQGRQLQPLLLG